MKLGKGDVGCVDLRFNKLNECNEADEPKTAAKSLFLGSNSSNFSIVKPLKPINRILVVCLNLFGNTEKVIIEPTK